MWLSRDADGYYLHRGKPTCNGFTRVWMSKHMAKVPSWALGRLRLRIGQSVRIDSIKFNLSSERKQEL